MDKRFRCVAHDGPLSNDTITFGLSSYLRQAWPAVAMIPFRTVELVPTRSRIHRRLTTPCRAATIFSVLAMMGAACARVDPINTLSSCQASAVQALRNHGPRVMVQCDLSTVVWVVGLPAGTIAADTLKATGLPEGAALGLAKREDKVSQLCTVQETARSEVPSGAVNTEERYRQFDIGCIASAYAITGPFVIRSQKVAFIVETGEDRRDPKIVIRAMD